MTASETSRAPQAAACAGHVDATTPGSRRGLLKRMMVMLLITGLVIGGIAAFKVWQIRGAIAASAQFAPPPAAVTTSIAKREPWHPQLHAVGSLKAVNGVTVSTDLPGIVLEIPFESGASVKKGDLLVKLDSRQEEARLRSAEARRDLTKTNLDRTRELVDSGAVSQSAFETSDSEYRQATAEVDEARALIARKSIVAPFDGRLGLRQVDVGQYLDVGGPIVHLESVDPIHVQFSLPQADYEKIAPGKKLEVQAEGLADSRFDGEISAIDSRLDEETRNIMIQGLVKNPDSTLRPGMFVQVGVLLPEQNVITIPASAISYAPYGNSVFIVVEKPGPDGKPLKVAEQHFVKLGPAQGDQVAVISGVEEGDEVVSSGAFKLRNGIAVTIDNTVQPGNSVQPTPPNT